MFHREEKIVPFNDERFAKLMEKGRELMAEALELGKAGSNSPETAPLQAFAFAFTAIQNASGMCIEDMVEAMAGALGTSVSDWGGSPDHLVGIAARAMDFFEVAEERRAAMEPQGSA